MLRFVPLDPVDFELYAGDLFSILWRNMDEIAPSENPYEEDFAEWQNYNQSAIASGERKTILFIDEEIDCIAGYFQYSIENCSICFDEIESLQDYWGKGLIYRPLMKYLLPQLPDSITHFKAYIHKSNLRSSAIIERMGAVSVGENPSGSSHLYCGTLADLIQWTNKE